MMWVGGSGMAFWRETWEVTPFMNSSNGEDTMYCMDAGIIKPFRLSLWYDSLPAW